MHDDVRRSLWVTLQTEAASRYRVGGGVGVRWGGLRSRQTFMAGMPSTVKDFERAVDKAARAPEWTHLSMFSVERLAAEYFDFGSRASGDLLARALENSDMHDEAAIVQLIRLGAPIEGGQSANGSKTVASARRSLSMTSATMSQYANRDQT